MTQSSCWVFDMEQMNNDFRTQVSKAASCESNERNDEEVLLIDDSRDVLLANFLMLKVNFGVNARVVDNPLKAVDIVKERVKRYKKREGGSNVKMFKLIISDMEMPEMDGE